MNSILIPFIAGLTTGGISCFAVQSGLMASAINEGSTKRENLNQVLLFLLAKIVAYSFLGAILGFIGSLFVFPPKMQAVIQLLIGIYLIGTAARMANLHPVFRYFAITPPKFLFKFARNKSKMQSSFAPVVAGFLTVLIPCGVTQAMLISAISSSSPVIGFITLFFFILGTIPSFVLLGVFAVEALKKKGVNIVMALVVFLLGMASINASLALFGTKHTAQNYLRVLQGNNSYTEATVQNGVQEISVFVSNGGYTLDKNSVKVGVLVRMKLITNKTYSCARAFTIPDFNITKILPETGEVIVEFTPKKTGVINFSCTMGMYTGSLKVTK